MEVVPGVVVAVVAVLVVVVVVVLASRRVGAQHEFDKKHTINSVDRFSL